VGAPQEVIMGPPQIIVGVLVVSPLHIIVTANLFQKDTQFPV
jgi:hypothetical protein